MKKKLICTLLALTLALPCALAETVPQATKAPETYDALYAEYSAAYQALDGVLGAQPGTAGSSLKGAIAACGLLDWAQELPEDGASRLPEEILSWYLNLSEDELAILDESFEAVLSQADDIAADFEDAKALLDDAGNPQKHEGYDQAKWQVVRDELARFLTWKTTQTNDKGANE